MHVQDTPLWIHAALNKNISFPSLTRPGVATPDKTEPGQTRHGLAWPDLARPGPTKLGRANQALPGQARIRLFMRTATLNSRIPMRYKLHVFVRGTRNYCREFCTLVIKFASICNTNSICVWKNSEYYMSCQ